MTLKIKGIIATALSKAETLLEIKPLSCQEIVDIPIKQGVYLIYNKGGKVIYVGKGENLYRRIKSEHISAENKITTSTFREKLLKVHGLKPGADMRRWIIENCSFAWVEINDKDITSVVENILITLLRNDNEKAELLNN